MSEAPIRSKYKRLWLITKGEYFFLTEDKEEAKEHVIKDGYTVFQFAYDKKMKESDFA